MYLNSVLWWLATSAIGWLSWPVVSRLFPHSLFTGYPYNRAFGLLLFAYPTWLLASLGLIPHTMIAVRTMAALLGITLLIIGWIYRKDLVIVLKNKWLYFIIIDLFYLLLFILLLTIKCYSPAIMHTEQPMDMMMLSSLLRSPDVPPADAWLAGYRVSYYYGGYFLVAQIAHLTGIAASEAYNLGLVSLYATAGVTGFGVLYELLQRAKASGKRWRITHWLVALAGVIALLFASNAAGIILAGEQIFSISPGTWLAKLGGPTMGPVGEWWWWQAGRAFLDTNWFGRLSDAITEFPAFSFLLGDLHPHLMALPFGLLALGVVIETANSARTAPWWRCRLCWAAPVCIGALGWINTWDLPVYALLLIGTYSLARLRVSKGLKALLPELIGFSAWLLMSLVLFLPFFRSLTTQVQGIGVTYYTKTGLSAFLLTQGLLFAPIIAYLLKTRAPHTLKRVILLYIMVTCLPWLLTLVIGSPGRVITGVAVSLGEGPWTALILAAVIALALDSLLDRASCADQIMTLLGLAGAGLLYVAEFLYVQDLFNSRMNTYFKLSYQSWIMLQIAAAAAWWSLLKTTRRPGWLTAGVCSALVVACCYICLSAVCITRPKPYTPTLDGSAYLRTVDPGAYGAIRWLNQYAVQYAVLLEATSADYTSGNRLSTFTGIPTLLGWPGHERQWRNRTDIISERQQDVLDIYTNPDRQRAIALLRHYGVDYVYLGETEIRMYQLSEEQVAWFNEFLLPVYTHADAALYQVP